MTGPKRFKENLTKATVIKRNGTETMGIDQDGVAKSIDIDVLLKIENIENGARADAVDALASGGPAGVYDTLAELQSDDPNHERIYVVTADGNWYYWGGSDWEAGGVYNDSTSFHDLAGAGRTTETVKGNADDILANAGDISQLESDLGDAEIDIATKESIANVNTLKGAGWTASQTVKGAYDSINIINSKYFSPSAVMGFEGRNLMDVFGTLTVPETFEALRASVLGGDFSHLRLGDYIDLDTFTVANWHNGYGYNNSPESSAWDTPFTVTKNLSYQNTRVEIVGFDDYYMAGNSAVAQHHVTMMFKNIPIRAQINKTDTTAEGYPGSDLFANLGKLYTAIAPQFGTATPRGVQRIVATTDSWGWVGVNEQIWIPTNMQIFGSPAFSHPQRGVGTQMQFPLLALNPSRRVKSWNGGRSYWWLAEPMVASSTHFCIVYSHGYATDSFASRVLGVAPAFLI
ncbi:MAG: hypothetical protein PHU58_07650 [Prevotella sp.]|nr:hypothetical protein [Prevotella sp.]